MWQGIACAVVALLVGGFWQGLPAKQPMHFEVWTLGHFSPIPQPIPAWVVMMLSVILAVLLGRIARSRVDDGCPFNSQFVVGFFLSLLAAELALLLAAGENISKSGITYEVWALTFGMLAANCWPRRQQPSERKPLSGVNTPEYCWPWLHKALTMSGEKGGEYYVKIALVLLGIELQEFLKQGLRGVIVSWVATPLILYISYMIGVRWMGASPLFMIIMSAATTVCGASAATALSESINRPETKDICTVIIAISTLLTLPQVFLLPEVSNAVHLDKDAAGAWIGSTIDSTGFVVASSSLLKDASASNLAATVKLIQNIIIAPLCVVVARHFAEEEKVVNNDDGTVPLRSSWLSSLWKNMPKFVIGFFAVSCMLTIFVACSEERGTLSYGVMQAFSQIFFAMGFFHIGFATDVREIWKKLDKLTQGDACVQRGKCARFFGKFEPVMHYCFVQGLDLLVKFCFCYVAYKILKHA